LGLSNFVALQSNLFSNMWESYIIIYIKKKDEYTRKEDKVLPPQTHPGYPLKTP